MNLGSILKIIEVFSILAVTTVGSCELRTRYRLEEKCAGELRGGAITDDDYTYQECYNTNKSGCKKCQAQTYTLKKVTFEINKNTKFPRYVYVPKNCMCINEVLLHDVTRQDGCHKTTSKFEQHYKMMRNTTFVFAATTLILLLIVIFLFYKWRRKNNNKERAKPKTMALITTQGDDVNRTA